MEANELPFRPLAAAEYGEVKEQLAAVLRSCGATAEVWGAVQRGEASPDSFYKVRSG